MNISKHANIRAQQRGFKKELIQFIYLFGIRRRRPGDVWEIIITKKMKGELIKKVNNKHFLQLLDKVCGKVLLVSNDNTLITTYIKY